MDALKLKVFPQIEERLGFDSVNYFLLIIFVCSGFTKVAVPIRKVAYGLWPTLIASKLLFTLIGVWEIAGIVLYHQKMFVPAYIMLFMFMGGVFSSITVINPKLLGAAVCAVPTTIFLLYTADKHSKDYPDINAVSSKAFLLIAFGYVIGFILHITSPKEKKDAKGTN